jgi:hypothetical protein
MLRRIPFDLAAVERAGAEARIRIGSAAELTIRCTIR